MADTTLRARFGLDATGFKTELKSLRGSVNKFANEWGKIGLAAAGAGLALLAREAIALGSKISDLAVQTRTDVEALQVLTAVARDAGLSQDDLAKSIINSQLRARQAAEGLMTYSREFDTLGINVQQFLALPSEQKLAALGKAYAAATDKNAAYNAVSQILGTKVGPRMMEVLDTLATKSFPALAEAAKKNGDVMSTETVLALDNAGDAIDAFKQRAQIVVGNIIVNFRTEEGTKLLELQLLKVVSAFGYKIIDAFREGASFGVAALTAAFAVSWNKFTILGNKQILAMGIALKAAFGLPFDRAAIVAVRARLKGVALDFGAALDDALAQTKPSNLGKEMASYYDEQIAKQQKIVDALNKAEFAGAAKKLKDAAGAVVDSGKALEEGATAGAEKLKDAGKSIADRLEQASKIMKDSAMAVVDGVFGMKFDALNGATLAGVDTATLQEIIRQTRNKLSDLKNPALNPNFNEFGTNLQAASLQAQLGNALRELTTRQKFQSDISGPGGIDAARRYYDPIQFEKLLQQFGPGSQNLQQQTVDQLKTLNDRIRAGITTKSLGG